MLHPSKTFTTDSQLSGILSFQLWWWERWLKLAWFATCQRNQIKFGRSLPSWYHAFLVRLQCTVSGTGHILRLQAVLCQHPLCKSYTSLSAKALVCSYQMQQLEQVEKQLWRLQRGVFMSLQVSCDGSFICSHQLRIVICVLLLCSATVVYFGCS